MPFNGMMLLPTELTLRTTREGVRLCSRPVREVESLLQPLFVADGQLGQAEAAEILNRFADHDGLHVHMTFLPSYSTSSVLRLNGQAIVDYDLNQNTLNGRFYAPQEPGSLSLTLDIYIDRTSVEVFVDDGLYSYSLARSLSENHDGFRLDGKELSVGQLRVDAVQSVW
jgi:sucrose-6-phosphate hydrolase SacC (GH32 family)